MSKRARTVIVRGAKRPIDKQAVIHRNITLGSQGNSLCYTATQAVTFVGAQLQVDYSPSTGNAQTYGVWLLVYVPEGRAPSTLSLVPGNNPYSPEQDILAMGVFNQNGDGTVTLHIGS